MPEQSASASVRSLIYTSEVFPLQSVQKSASGKSFPLCFVVDSGNHTKFTVKV